MIGILDADLGNLRSLSNALFSLGYDFKIVSSGDGFDSLTHLIIPGVGSYYTAMGNIDRQGLRQPIRRFAQSGRPLLGICLGLQVLCGSGEEVQPTEGLGLLAGRVIPFSRDSGLPVPHVGWNSVHQRASHPVFAKVKADVDFYFVHSYYYSSDHPQTIFATTDYGIEFCSVAVSGNVLGFQFHPEKSQTNGLRLLENFCEWDGRC